MLQQLGIRLCLARAGECERLAELAGDPRSKESYIRIANLWRALAAHREFVEQIDSLLAPFGVSEREEFDPAVYFPKLFVPYLKAMSLHLESLLPLIGNINSPQNFHLLLLYQADLDAFVDL